MSKLAPTDARVQDHLDAIEHPGRREDAYALLDLFHHATGFEPRMWGTTIVGFGTHHYCYASGHEGDGPIAAFSPRKANMVVYFAPGFLERSPALTKLGKHKAGKGCLYIGRFSNIDLNVLEDLIVASTNLTA